jgi:hypothetical protein
MLMPYTIHKEMYDKNNLDSGFKGWFLHNDNAAIYHALSVHGFQAKRMTHSRPSLPTRFNAL